MSTGEKLTVATPSQAYRQMAAKWELIDALMGGRKAMIAGGEKWLPKEPDEVHYEDRLNRSHLFFGYKDTVRKLVSKPFQKAVTFAEDTPLPGEIVHLETNADKTGSTLTQVARKTFQNGVSYGLSHLLVDFPQSQAETAADELREGVRASVIPIDPRNLIGWTTTINEAGETVLESVRIKEVVEEQVELWHTKKIDQIRILTRTTWHLFRKKEKEEKNDEWELYLEGTHTLGEVPLVSFYTNQTGYMTAEPPLDGLAEANLEHYQSSAEQRNILRFARGGIFVVTGHQLETDEAGETIPLKIAAGGNSAHVFEEEGAKAGFAEHSGQSISAGFDDLDRLEKRMERMGLAPLVERSGAQTATGKKIDQSNANSDMMAWIKSLEAALNEAIELALRWTNTEMPEGLSAQVFDDFTIDMGAGSDLDTLHKMRQSGDLSKQTLLNETKRRGVLPEGFNVDEELGRIEEEAPDLSEFTRPPNFGDGEGEGEGQ